MSLSACLPSISQHLRNWRNGGAKDTDAEAALTAPEKRAALQHALEAIANLGDAGITLTREGQKHYDWLQEKTATAGSAMIDAGKVARRLRRVESALGRQRTSLQAQATAWTSDWMMGTERFDGEQLRRLYTGVEAVNGAVKAAGDARATLQRVPVKQRPVSI